MSITLIGALALVCGLFLFLREKPIVYLFVGSTALGSAAAFNLPALGGASILVPHLLLGFFALSVVLRLDSAARLLDPIRPGTLGFWCLLLTVYALGATILFPRVFAGLTDVFVTDRTLSGAAILRPLAPTKGNITQTIYVVGNLVCFLATFLYARDETRVRTLAKAGLVCAFVVIGFGALDLITYYTGTVFLMDFVRTANYAMLDETVILGFKRIVGSFPEASGFADASMQLFGFVIVLWFRGRWTRWTGLATALLLLGLFFSTSSAALVSLVVFLSVLIGFRVWSVLEKPANLQTIMLTAVLPLCVLTLSLILMIHPDSSAVLAAFYDQLLGSKLESDSGVERMSWNAQGLANFVETYGLGVGLGSTRTSSFIVASLASVGAIGTLLLFVFLGQIIFQRQRYLLTPDIADIQLAARVACVGVLIPAAIIKPSMDFGLLFYMFAGIVAATLSYRPKMRQA